jgi:hypothetical protein
MSPVVIAAWWLLGCSEPPVVHRLDVETGACGRFSGEVEVEAPASATLVVQGGPTPLGSWAITERATQTFAGAGTPGTPILVEARLGPTYAGRIVELPEQAVVATLSPTLTVLADGLPAVLALTTDSPCQIPFDYVVRVDGRLGPKGQVDASAAPVLLAPPGPGRHRVTAELSARGHRIAMTEAIVYVGDASLDQDLDGSPVGTDCDDTDLSRSPLGSESKKPNGIDDDCDGLVDEDTEVVDDDHDGFSEAQGDCDDIDPERFPGAPEKPDCRDNDCDGEIDEGAPVQPVDDSYEPNDTEKGHPVDLAPEDIAHFDKSVTFILRDEGDREWLQLPIHPGPIEVTVTGQPQGSKIAATTWHMGVLVRSVQAYSAKDTLTSPPPEDFMLRKQPVKISITPHTAVPAWCPVTVRIRSL